MKSTITLLFTILFQSIANSQNPKPLEGTFLGKTADTETLFLFSKEGKVYYFSSGGALTIFLKGNYTQYGDKVSLSFPPEEKNMFALYATHNPNLIDSIKIEYRPSLHTEEALHFMVNDQAYLLETPSEHNSRNPLRYTFKPNKKINEMVWFIENEDFKEFGSNSFITKKLTNYNSFKIVTQREKLVAFDLEKIAFKWDGKNLTSKQLYDFVYNQAPEKDNSNEINDFEKAYENPANFEENELTYTKIEMQPTKIESTSKPIKLNYKIQVEEERGAELDYTSSHDDTTWMEYFSCDLKDGFYWSSLDENEVCRKDKAEKIVLNIKEFYVEDSGFIFIRPKKRQSPRPKNSRYLYGF